MTRVVSGTAPAPLTARGAMLASLVFVALSGCRPVLHECCEPNGDELFMEGIIGHIDVCACGGICEYGALGPGHVVCSDDPSGRACLVVRHPQSLGRVRCFDEGGPARSVACCEDVGTDGLGTPSTCRCPVVGRCPWDSVTVERVGADRCRVRDPYAPDAPMSD